jgi:hypothetical protein
VLRICRAASVSTKINAVAIVESRSEQIRYFADRL